MRRPTWALLASAAVVVAIFFLLHDAAVELESPRNAAEPARVDAVPLVAPIEDTSPPLRQEQVAEEPAVPPQTSVLHVLVRDESTHAPVAGARVEACPSTTLMRSLAGTGLHTPAGRRLRASLLIVAVADDAGIAELKVPEEVLMLEARSQGLWGFKMLPVLPAERRAEIAIGADRELRVRVVDEGGRPRAGVPVAVRRQTDPPPRVRFGGQATESEAPDGVATFLHFQRRVQQGPGWHLTFAFPVRDPPALAVDADTPREVPEPLVLPPTGGLRIRVRNGDGEVPDLRDCDLHCTATADGEPVGPGSPWVGPHLDPRTGDAEVPWLGLGLQLQIELHHRGHAVASATAEGPGRAGEVPTCELRTDLAACRLVRGRFVRNDGRPWPPGTVTALALLEPVPRDYPQEQEVAVADQGRFVLEVRDARPAEGTRRYRFTAPHPEGGLARTVVALDGAVPREGLDLGDVVLDHGPLLVAGRVVDAHGQAVAGAQLQLFVRRANGESLGSAILAAGTPQSGDDGRFALFLPPGERDPGPSLLLTTTCKGFVPERNRECRRGDGGLNVVLQQSGGLCGSFVLGNGLAAEDLSAFFLTGDVRQPGALHHVDIHADGDFTAETLPAGPCTFTVNRRGADGELERTVALRVDGLQVIAGRVDSDPRLQRLRVEPVGVVVRVRVLAPGGTPLTAAVASAAGASVWGTGLAGSDGVCRVRVPGLPADVEVQAYGYRSRLLAGVTADSEVTLDHGIPVRLSAGVRGRGSSPPYHLSVHLFDVDAGGKVAGMTSVRTWPASQHDFDADGTIDVVLPRSGVFVARVYALAMRTDGDRQLWELPLRPPPRFTVQEGSTRQAFDLGIPQSAVDEVLARLR